MSGISGCLFKQKIPTLKIIFVLQYFPCLFPSLPLCTHIHTFLLLFAVWKTQRFLKTKKLVVKDYNIQGCFLIGNLEASKKSVKNYSLCCVVYQIEYGWFASSSTSFSLVISSWLQFLKYMALHAVQLNIIQFLCCHPKDFSLQSVGYFSLLWCW